MRNILHSLKIITLAIFLSLGLSYVYAWTAPTTQPPDGNTSAPLNTSITSQYKGGALGIEGLLRGYTDAIFDGNVGIGTVAPLAKLDVAGSIKVGQTTATCNASQGGALRYNTTEKCVEYCDETTWACFTQTPPATISFSATPATLGYNTSAILNWSSTNATSCTSSGAWAGARALSGSEGTGNLTSTQTYTLTCTAEGTSVSQSVTVSVNPPPPPPDGGECSSEGLVHIIPDESMHDGGGSAAGDSLQVYCRYGTARWCLSGEYCPWRDNIASSDSTTCSRSGLGGDWMAVAWSNQWNSYYNYYCSSDSQKYGTYD